MLLLVLYFPSHFSKEGVSLSLLSPSLPLPFPLFLSLPSPFPSPFLLSFSFFDILNESNL